MIDVCSQSICIYKLHKIICKPLPVFVQERLHSSCPMIVWRQVASHQLMCTITLRLKGIPATTCSWFLNVKKLIVITGQPSICPSCKQVAVLFWCNKARSGHMNLGFLAMIMFRLKRGQIWTGSSRRI